jgi:hypothetical protein
MFEVEQVERGLWLTLKSKRCLCSCGELTDFVAIGSGSSSHLRFAPSSSSGDGPKFLNESPGTVTIPLSFFSAEGSKVEFAAVVDYNKGGLSELDLLQAVQ